MPPPALVTGTSTGIGRAIADATRRRYERLIAALSTHAERQGRDGLPPEAVAEVVGRALAAKRPRTRYVIGREATMQAVAARLLPDRAFDALVRRALAT
jgi:NAD(P)-dependent dehydrogenase (short-subunit alcohol dehydrogenase family)